MFEETIKEGKPRPDFSGTDNFQVSVTLTGEIQNPEFLGFLAKVGRERLATFTTLDLPILDAVRREESLVDELKSCVPHLLEQGIIERIGRGRGTRLILSRGPYDFMGKGGAYTRRKGLDRETNKALLLRHVERAGSSGAAFTELQQVLPALSRRQIQGLLQELRTAGKVALKGHRRYARWQLTPDRQVQTGQGQDGA